MEYVIGGDFLSLLEHLKILTEDQTRFYAAEMVLAIEEAHSLHFIHRDIKPGWYNHQVQTILNSSFR